MSANLGIPAILGAVLSWLAVRKLDAFVGKWLAIFTIAWEEKASEASKMAFAAAMLRIKENLPENAGKWEEWRKGNATDRIGLKDKT